MQQHEIDCIAQVFEKLSRPGEITPELRAYLTGRLETLLAPYKQEVGEKPRRITDIFKNIGIGE